MLSRSKRFQWSFQRHGLRTIGVIVLLLTVMGLAGSGRPEQVAAQIGGLNLSLTASPTNAQTGQSVTFTYTATPPAVAPPFASIQALFIDFGDGDSTTGNTTSGPGQTASGSVAHIYTVPGTYTATLSGLATNGASGTAIASVVVGGGGNPPAVSLTAIPTTAQVGQPVTFNYSASVAPGITFPTIRNMLINYGDGAPLPLTPPAGVVTHTYNAPGFYPVLLTATDSNGQTGQSSANIQVTPASTSGRPPSNVLIVNPQSAAPAGQTVTFNAATATTVNTGASIQSYAWNFGDGGTSIGQSVSHAFTSPGTYTVTLTVTDTTGASAQNSTQITIASSAPPPAPGVSVTFQSGWNLIAAPNGTTIPGPLGPLYTFQPGDSAYQVVQNPQTGLGYWAFFSTPTTATIPFGTSQTFTKFLPAGQFVMLGNPGSTTATISGADIVYVYNATTGYQQTTTLQPGQGVWALSTNGATVTITGAAR